MNIPPPQIAALEARVAKLERMLAGTLFTAQTLTSEEMAEQVKTGRASKLQDICLGGTLSFGLSPIPEEK